MLNAAALLLRGGSLSSSAAFTRSISTSRLYRFPVVPFKLSDIGEGIAEVQVKEWHIKEGDRVAQFDQLCDVQSDKAAVTISSRYDGVVKKLHYKVDDIARVGQPLLDIEIEAEEGAEKTPKEEQKKDASSPSACPAAPATVSVDSSAVVTGKALATPAVRRVAIENKVDLSRVPATGRGGRVLKEDVLKFIGQISDRAGRGGSVNIRSSPATTTASSKTFEPLREDVVVPIRGYMRAMVKSMSEALKIPHFGYDDEFVVNGLVKVRSELKYLAKQRNIKLSYMPFIIKAASVGLLEHPSLNATVDAQVESVTQRAAHNICVAIDTPSGLVVPVIKHCEQRTIFEIAEELDRLTVAATRQQLARDDLSDGTFTLSNIGAIGGTYASPVILPPQVAIGAIGRLQKLPRYDDEGNVRPTYVMNFSWAADHRVVDGATMARFSNRMKGYLENPATLLAMLK